MTLKKTLDRSAKAVAAIRAILQHGRPSDYCTFADNPTGGIGDSLLCGAVLLGILKSRPDARIWLDVPPAHLALFREYPAGAGIFAHGGVHRAVAQRLGARTRALAYESGDHSRDIFTVPSRHIFASMCANSGFAGAIDLLPRIYLSEAERKAGKRVEGMQAAIHSSGLAAKFPMHNKEWQTAKFQAVVDAFSSQGIRFVQLGSPGDPLLSNTVDLRGNLSLRESAAVLSQSAVFVGLVGGLMHMARAVDCRSVIIYGGREHPWQSGYVANENIAWQGECAPCWRYSECDFERRCMAEITAADVEAAVKRQLQKVGTPLPTDNLSV